MAMAVDLKYIGLNASDSRDGVTEKLPIMKVTISTKLSSYHLKSDQKNKI